jgi:hypothetical protein
MHGGVGFSVNKMTVHKIHEWSLIRGRIIKPKSSVKAIEISIGN